MLSEILMLVLGFALPVINDEGAKDFDDSFGDFDSGTVGNELVHSSPFADDIFECVDKLFLGMHSVNINDKGFTTNEDPALPRPRNVVVCSNKGDHTTRKSN